MPRSASTLIVTAIVAHQHTTFSGGRAALLCRVAHSSLAEIGAALGKSEETMRQYSTRARHVLKEQSHDDGP